MAIYTMSFIGMLPVGSLLMGSIAHRAGVQAVFLLAGIAGLAMAFVFKTDVAATQGRGTARISRKRAIA